MGFLSTGFPNNSELVGCNKRSWGIFFEKELMGIIVHYIRQRKKELTAR